MTAQRAGEIGNEKVLDCSSGSSSRLRDRANGLLGTDASAATYDGAKEGTKVTVKYTEKGGEKTAVAVKDASKATAKAVTQ